jgi:alkylhydroperoxidase family enzyme
MPTNMERAFDTHPEILAAWVQLNTAIKSRMPLRRYELATVAAAQRLRSSYCSLAHGKVLRDDCGAPLADIVRDRRRAGLDELDVAVMDLAEKVVDDATAIDEGDRQRLRDLGLSDDEIMDVVLAATARCFLSKTLDALGVLPDAFLRDDFTPNELELLVVGRPIAALG